MKNTSILVAIAMALVISLSAPALAFARGPTIVETAIAANEPGGVLEGELDILIAALLAEEDLVERLSARGQYTVFAPTDSAFEALFAETGLTAEEVLENPALLSAVLSYHVAPGVRQAQSVTRASRINTLNGEFLRVVGTVLTDVNGRQANIVATDIRTSNGVVHVIDRVVLPTLS